MVFILTSKLEKPLKPGFMRAPSGLEVLDELLETVSVTVSSVLDISGTRYRDANNNRSGIFYVGWNPWRWTELPEGSSEAVQAAKKAVSQLSEFSSLASKRSPDVTKSLIGLDEDLLGLVEQSNGSSGAAAATIPLVREHLGELIAKYRSDIHGLPNASGQSERLLVADTSALLDEPSLQDWSLDGTAWTVVILPQVLVELDERKRDSRTRDAARKVINTLEELDRRGNTLEGVVVAGNLSAREVPRSPNMNETLGWLRSDVPDDHIIAGALELSWEDLTATVAVVASDRNVRNKARLAGLTPIRTEMLRSASHKDHPSARK